MKYSKKDYFFVRFEKSKTHKKKYDAVIKHKLTKKVSRVPFGSRGAEQYADTALGLYAKFDHMDLKRKKNYRARHKVYLKPGYYSPAYFSWTFLWN